MKKTFVRPLIAMVMLCALLCSSVSATTHDNQLIGVDPRLVGLAALNADLEIFSNGWAACDGYTRTQSGYSVEVELELQRDGRTIKCWDATGTIVNINKGYYVSTGYTYQVVVTATVKNSSGQVVAIETDKSISVNY